MPPLFNEPQWLTWTREMQAIAQNGLAFTQDPYDRERFEQLRQLASHIMAHHTQDDAQLIKNLFATQSGYATPKVDVRGAVFQDGELLLVREAADQDRWTLPGGWADVNASPSQSVIKEVQEESGFQVTVQKLAAVWDRRVQMQPVYPFHVYKLFFLCEIVGGHAATSMETSEVAFFRENGLPPEEALSKTRVSLAQLQQMFKHFHHPALPTDFD